MEGGRRGLYQMNQLFILYINDICNASSIGKFILFADDTTVVFSVPKNLDPSATLNVELDKICVWLQCNKLSLNAKKTQAIAFNLDNQESINLTMHNEKLQFVDEINFLGIIFDKKLTWKSHINMTYKKIHSGVGALLRCRRLLPLKIMKMIFYSIVHPHVLYGLILWGSAGSTALRQLKSCYSRAINISLNTKVLSRRTSTAPNILSLPKLYEIQLGTFMFNAFNNKLPPNIQQNFSLNRNIHQTRNSEINFKVVCKDTKIFNNKLTVKGPYFWNALPPQIKTLNSIQSFRNKLKKHIMN